MKPSIDALVRRKDEHIDHVLAGRGRSTADAGFDVVRFQHNAMPELNYDDIDLTVRFMGKELAAPFLISSMTGGPARAAPINARMAEAAEGLRIAFAVGSQRVAIDSRADLGLGRELRRLAPTALILANLGAVQFSKGYGLDEARRAVEMIGADGLVLHLNPLQEAIQAEGDRDWRGVEAAIAKVAEAFPGRLVVKETGAGLSGDVVRRLRACGVSAIDVAGSGGTNWGLIEGARALGGHAEAVVKPFSGWGVPTARALVDASLAAPDLALIASGGIRDGLDAGRAIRLGALLVGQAAGVLEAAMVSADAVVAHFAVLRDQLRLACFCTGSADLQALGKAPLLDAIRF